MYPGILFTMTRLHFTKHDEQTSTLNELLCLYLYLGSYCPSKLAIRGFTRKEQLHKDSLYLPIFMTLLSFKQLNLDMQSRN